MRMIRAELRNQPACRPRASRNCSLRASVERPMRPTILTAVPSSSPSIPSRTCSVPMRMRGERLRGNPLVLTERNAHPNSRAATINKMPIVATFHTSERISGTPAA